MFFTIMLSRVNVTPAKGNFLTDVYISNCTLTLVYTQTKC